MFFVFATVFFVLSLQPYADITRIYNDIPKRFFKIKMENDSVFPGEVISTDARNTTLEKTME